MVQTRSQTSKRRTKRQIYRSRVKHSPVKVKLQDAEKNMAAKKQRQVEDVHIAAKLGIVVLNQ